nr:MAG TPA: hypothetical protein [Bacteriophage sp.]
MISVTAFIIALQTKKPASLSLRAIKKKNRISFLYLKFIL